MTTQAQRVLWVLCSERGEVTEAHVAYRLGDVGAAIDELIDLGLVASTIVGWFEPGVGYRYCPALRVTEVL